MISAKKSSSTNRGATIGGFSGFAGNSLEAPELNDELEELDE
jgi:hypothetical protein